MIQQTQRKISHGLCMLLLICLLAPAFHAAAAGTGRSARTVQDEKLTITGVVKDNTGEPLIEVYVFEKGTQNGTATDLDGRFTIKVQPGSLLVVSYIGMKTKEVAISAQQQEYTVILEPDTELLEEVVVTGYQTLSKERSTGAFEKVDSKTLEFKRMDNLGSMLEGQVAGYVDGKIRGVTTMNAVANPMVVIDGFPVENTTMNRAGQTAENMPDLNPEDIESITVLKDAAAASIYGARAANGVIVITTKKAKQGRTDISFSATFTAQKYKYYIDNMTDANDIVTLQKRWAAGHAGLNKGGEDALQAAGSIRDDGTYPALGVDILLDRYTGKISASEADSRLAELAGKGYQYYDQVNKYAKRNPFTQQYNLRVGKTTEKNSFNFSASYWGNRFEDKNSDGKKLGLNMSNSVAITKWMQADFGVYIKMENNHNQSYDPYNPGFSIMPYDALVNPDGSYFTAASQIDKTRRDVIAANGLHPEVITPMNELGYNVAHTRSLDTRSFVNLKINFCDFLNYNAMFQYETSNSKTESLNQRESNYVTSILNDYVSKQVSWQGEYLVYNLPEGDVLYTNDNTRRGYSFRHQLNFNKTFNRRHNLVWILGQEIRHSKIEFYDNNIFGYDPELMTWPAYDAKKLSSFFDGLMGYKSLNPNNITSKREIMNRFVSFYANASYTVDNKYVLTGSLRWDRSNLWGTSSKYQNKPIWSVGASWNIDREDFFNSKVFDMLKLRVTYGIGGNIGRNTAPYLIAKYYASSFVDGMYGVVSTPPNDDIRWEKTSTFDLGVDFGMFRNRLSGSIDFYNKSSVDLLANINGSPTQGFGYASLTTNNGEMTNRGVDLSINGSIIQGHEVSWDASLLYSFNRNKVTKVSIKAPNYDSRLMFPTSYPMIGNPYFGIYGYEWAGLDANGDPQVYDAEGNITSDDVRDADAVLYQGSTIPAHSGTFTNMLSYKNFEFSIMLTFAAGHKIRDPFPPAISMGEGKIFTTNRDIMDSWQKPGDENHTNVPRLLFSNDRENYNSYRSNLYRYSDLFIYDASHLRVNNISLAYRIPKQICNKIAMQGIKVQFNVENVATWAFDSRAHFALGGKIKPNYVFGLYLNL